jgi:hypothetical protein
MEQAFHNWLIKRGNSAAANSYPRAIHTISDHYSKETGTKTNIYSIQGQLAVSEIAHDYSQTGKYAQFGYEQHGRFRAAIGRYSEFFVQHVNEEPLASIKVEAQTAELPDQSTQASSNFAYEKDLQTSLCAQITELFPDYKIFGNGLLGIEYSIGGKRIDVLLESKDGHKLLAVELKSGIADFKVFGQISMYIGLLTEQFPNHKISGIIVAGGIDSSLKQACSITNRITLKTYRMSIELDDA